MAGSGPARAEKAVLECTADAWVARSQASPHGREAELALPADGAALLDFRTAAVAGWRIAKATLLLHVADGRRPERVHIAAMRLPWSEASATWALLALPRGRGRRVRPYLEGWVAIDVRPADIGPHGLAVSGARARFSARESVGHAPYLLVEGSR